jgi:hypothetical protein
MEPKMGGDSSFSTMQRRPLQLEGKNSLRRRSIPTEVGRGFGRDIRYSRLAGIGGLFVL